MFLNVVLQFCARCSKNILFCNHYNIWLFKQDFFFLVLIKTNTSTPGVHSLKKYKHAFA